MKSTKDVAPMPAEIIKAVASVTGEVGKVERDQHVKNDFKNFKAASADAIYGAVSNIMAKHGLIMVCLETDLETMTVKGRKGDERWGKFTYEFVLAAGESTWSDPRFRRTVIHRLFGPESHQSAQSYAEKACMRSLFKIQTGDIEQVEQEDAPKKSKASMKKQGGEWDQIEDQLEHASNMTDIMDIEQQWHGKLPDDWQAPFYDKLEGARARILNGFN
jgi:hypothetical protein